MGNCARKLIISGLHVKIMPRLSQALGSSIRNICNPKPKSVSLMPCNINDKRLDFGGGNVCVITDKRSWDEKISEASKNGKIVVVNFSSSCCEPCKGTAPTFAELSVKYPSLVFLTVDVDELSEISELMNINMTPTFFFFKDGQPAAKVVGTDEVELLKKVALFSESSA